MTEAVVLLGCGDVGPIHEPIGHYSELVRETLRTADIRFAQVERVYSERGELQPHGGAHGRLPPHMASVVIGNIAEALDAQCFSDEGARGAEAHGASLLPRQVGNVELSGWTTMMARYGSK
jgi:hypothetical protein